MIHCLHCGGDDCYADICDRCAANRFGGVIDIQICGMCYATVEETIDNPSNTTKMGWDAYWWLPGAIEKGPGSICPSCREQNCLPADDGCDGPIAKNIVVLGLVNVEISTLANEAVVGLRLTDGSLRVFRHTKPELAPTLAKMAWRHLGPS